MRPAAALALLLAACGQGQADHIDVAVVDAEGLDPLGRIPSGTIRIVVDQGPGLVSDETFDISGGTFDAPVPITSYVNITNIQVVISDDGGNVRAIGALFDFVPIQAGAVWIVVGEPSTCAPLVRPELDIGRIDAALVPVGVGYYVVGGLRDTTPDALGHDLVGAVLPLYLTAEMNAAWNEHGMARPLSVPLGAARAVRVGSSSTVVVVGDDRAFTIDPLSTDVVPDHPMVAPDAGAGSTLVSLGNSGVAIVGGGTAAAPSRSITWRDQSGGTTTTQLATARYRPAVAAVGASSGILVAGGQLPGEPLFEYVQVFSYGAPIEPSRTEARPRPILVRDPDHQTALLLGGDDRPGDTWIVSGCPDCVVSPGPTWTRPRTDLAVVETAEATLLLGGGDPLATDVVDRVVITGTSVALEEGRATLSGARSRAAAAGIGSGVVILVGGADENGDPVRTLDICWPPALEGLPPSP